MSLMKKRDAFKDILFCIMVCVLVRVPEKQNEQWVQSEKEKQIYFKELGHGIVVTGKSKICRVGQKNGTQRRGAVQI